MNKNDKRKILFKSSQIKKKYNNCVIFPKIYKITFIFVLFSIIILLSTSKFILKEKIEEELNNLEINQTDLNWDNVKNDFEFLSNKYKYLIKYENNISEYSPIWMMWYQGIENAPPIVKSCVQSVILNRAKHPVYIIDKYNLEKYIKLPSYIKEKFNKGAFSIAHFSDIVRMGLLLKYGGYWIDSTYLVNTPLIKVNTSFYSLKLNYCFPHRFIKCQWAINFMAVPPNSFIATYCYAALLFYLKKYNSFINYFLLDYIILIAYNNVLEFKNLITNLPFVNCNIFSLVKSLNYGYNKDKLKCSFNKLTRKKVFNAFNTNGKTNYGYIIEKYNLNIKNINNNFIAYLINEINIFNKYKKIKLF